jgi:RhtB (resistance to homoserine/threonine) family protein
MLTQFFTLGLLMLLASILPGPDFVVVTKNTLSQSRRAGLFTCLGTCFGTLVHITYCILGLAILISQSRLAFNLIKYAGGAYLIYLGITALLARRKNLTTAANSPHQTKTLSDVAAFRQGFFCNLLNPKASLFYLAIFTVMIKPETPVSWEIILGAEMFCIQLVWFTTLTFILSHPAVYKVLNQAEYYIAKTLGVFLIGLGVLLTLVKQ